MAFFTNSSSFCFFDCSSLLLALMYRVLTAKLPGASKTTLETSEEDQTTLETSEEDQTTLETSEELLELLLAVLSSTSIYRYNSSQSSL